MADEEHLAILKQGVETWNQWREEHNTVRADLRGADLRGANLRGASLSLANLRGANLSRASLSLANLRGANLSRASLSLANLREADLIGAELSRANLREANLSDAELSRANLREANLSDAELSRANLIGADLIGADLIGADLIGADLIGADLIEADLSDADLRRADLRGADLREAYLRGADLRGAYLRRADLREADLREAYLRGADLSDAYLIGADLSDAYLIGADLSDAYLTGTNLYAARVLNANFSGATLTGACIADWQMGSSTTLKNIRCDYIFRTFDRETHKFSGRLPVDPSGTFAPGEFDEWVKVRESSLETIDITFTEGIDWQAFFNSLEEVRQQYPNSGVSMQSIEEKGGTYVVRLRLDTEATGEDLEKLRAEVETKTKALYESERRFIESCGEIKALERSLDKTLEKLAMANNHTENTTFNQQGANIPGGVAGKNYGKMVATQHNYAPEQKQNLAEAAAEIRGILEELEQSYPTNTTAEKMTVAAKAIERIERDPTFKQRVTNAVKEGGLKAFERAIDNPFGAFVAGAVEGWQDAEAEQT